MCITDYEEIILSLDELLTKKIEGPSVLTMKYPVVFPGYAVNEEI